MAKWFRLWICFASLSAAAARQRLPVLLQSRLQSPARPSSANCTWRTFTQRLDQFGNGSETFGQRYCVYDAFWKSGTEASKGPIFFYTGNESPVEVYINNTGLMWELGRKKGALLVFAEHRYEPLSHPCLQGTSNCFGYCTTAQALADYAALIAELRRGYGGHGVPVVAFGGSYGGMLAGWFRIKYPHVIAGSIAASAPIWGLAKTMERDRLDWTSRAISRGVSSLGGASDVCLANLRASWPLISEVGRAPRGLALLSRAVGSCREVDSVAQLLQWAQAPWFLLAEGNYPFASTYITFSVGPGYVALPPWPMRVACEELNRDFGVELSGSVENVTYTLRMGDVFVDVDWSSATGNGGSLSSAEIEASGVLSLVGAVAKAAGVWYNVTKDKSCYDMTPALRETATPPDPDPEMRGGPDPDLEMRVNHSGDCPSCPVCDGCPSCPVSDCRVGLCNYHGEVSKTFSWDGVTCNDELWMYNTQVQGVGHDLFWPPTVKRNATIEDVVGVPPGQKRVGCGADNQRRGLLGTPQLTDPWSAWATSYYGGANISMHRNIVWSQGLLDPWSGGGVYPPDGGIDGPLRQNISADGSQVALLIDLGGHHLDLFFSDPANDPPSVVEVRKIEEEMIDGWCQEWRDANQGKRFDEVVV